MTYLFDIVLRLVSPEGLTAFFSTFCIGCFGNPGKEATKAAKRRERAITQGTEKVNKAFATYTPEFYQARSEAFKKAMMPQLAEQAGQTERLLSYNLANKGLFDSSAGATLGESLQNAYARNKMAVSDAAQQAANDLESQVENYRANLLAQVEAAADPLSTAGSLAAGATQFQAPGAVPAVTDAFGNWVNTFLLSNMNSLGGGAGQSFAPRWNTGSSKGSIKTVK